MKLNHALVALSFFLAASAHARGGLSSGGIVPAAPRAIVVQESLREGETPDPAVEEIVKRLADEDRAAGKAIDFKSGEDEVVNNYWRKTWCVEYTNFDAFVEASNVFKEELKSFNRVYVGSNGACSRF